MQFFDFLQVLGITILVIGVMMILIGFFLSSRKSDMYETKKETKGFILIGPIPILYGASKQTQIALCLIGIFVVIFILLFF